MGWINGVLKNTPRATKQEPHLRNMFLLGLNLLSFLPSLIHSLSLSLSLSLSFIPPFLSFVHSYTDSLIHWRLNWGKQRIPQNSRQSLLLILIVRIPNSEHWIWVTHISARTIGIWSSKFHCAIEWLGSVVFSDKKWGSPPRSPWIFGFFSTVESRLSPCNPPNKSPSWNGLEKDCSQQFPSFRCGYSIHF